MRAGMRIDASIRAAAAFTLFLGVACSADIAKTETAGPVSALPAPRTTGAMSLEEAIARRRSVRAYAAQPLTPAELGQLLWAMAGITETAGRLRASPSAGALYPLEIYVIDARGVSRYLPEGHRIQRVAGADLRGRVALAAGAQSALLSAPAVIAITGVNARTAAKYGDRAERYVLLEAGHAAQNALLAATSMNLGAVPIGAFDDEALRAALDLPVGEAPIYLIPVGHPARAARKP